MSQAAKLSSGQPKPPAPGDSSRERKSSMAEKPEGQPPRQLLQSGLCRHAKQITCVDCRLRTDQTADLSEEGQKQQQQEPQQPPLAKQQLLYTNLETRLQRSLRITSVSTTSMPLLERLRTQPRLSLASQRLPEKLRAAAPVDSSRLRRRTHDGVTAPGSAAETRPVSATPQPPPTPQSMATPRLRPADPNDPDKYRRSHHATMSIIKSRRFTRLLRRRPRHADGSLEEEFEAVAEAAFDASAATSSPFFSYFMPLPRYRERGRDILTLVKPPRDRFRERLRRRQEPTARQLAYGGVDPGDFLHVLEAESTSAG